MSQHSLPLSFEQAMELEGLRRCRFCLRLANEAHVNCDGVCRRCMAAVNGALAGEPPTRPRTDGPVGEKSPLAPPRERGQGAGGRAGRQLRAGLVTVAVPMIVCWAILTALVLVCEASTSNERPTTENVPEAP